MPDPARGGVGVVREDSLEEVVPETQGQRRVDLEEAGGGAGGAFIKEVGEKQSGPPPKGPPSLPPCSVAQYELGEELGLRT